MKAVQIMDAQEDPRSPCQLKKLVSSGGIACSMYCAMIHECSVMYINSHDQPIVQGLSKLDLEPLTGGSP